MTFIDWIEENSRDSFCAFVVIECMSKTGIDKFGQFDSSNINVEMKINGIDVDFKQCMEYIESQMDDYKERIKDDMYDVVKEELISILESM